MSSNKSNLQQRILDFMHQQDPETLLSTEMIQNALSLEERPAMNALYSLWRNHKICRHAAKKPAKGSYYARELAPDDKVVYSRNSKKASPVPRAKKNTVAPLTVKEIRALFSEVIVSLSQLEDAVVLVAETHSDQVKKAEKLRALLE